MSLEQMSNNLGNSNAFKVDSLGDEVDYKITKLNLLAFPRNQIPVCELTGARATVELVTEHYTLYYASSQLASQAWESIIHKIVRLFPSVFQPPQIVGTHDERIQQAQNIKHSKKVIADFCMKEAANYLNNKNYSFAIPPVVQALKFYQDLDGDKSLSSVEPYLKLAQAYLGLNEYKRAEEYLAYSRWIIMNITDCPEEIRAQVHMLIGQVNAAQSDTNNAKTEFASAIYYSSKHSGPDSLMASIGYFRLGEVFLMDGKIDNALAFDDKVIDVWFRYLSSLRSAHSSTGSQKSIETNNETNNNNTNNNTVSSSASSSSNELLPEQSQLLEQLTEENVADGLFLLSKIIENRQKHLGVAHIATGEAQYTLGLMYFFLLGDEKSAESLVSQAENIYLENLGEKHKSLQDVRNVLLFIRQEYNKKMVIFPAVDENEVVLNKNHANNAATSSSINAANTAANTVTNTTTTSALPVIDEMEYLSNELAIDANINSSDGGGANNDSNATTAAVIDNDNNKDNNDEVPMSARERVRFKSMLVHIPRNEPVVVESAENSLPPSAILFDQLVHHKENSFHGSSSPSTDVTTAAATTAASSHTTSTPSIVPDLSITSHNNISTTATATASTGTNEVPMTARTYEKVHFKSMLQVIPRNEPVVEDTTSALPPSAILFENIMHKASGVGHKGDSDGVIDAADSGGGGVVRSRSNSGRFKNAHAHIRIPSAETTTTGISTTDASPTSPSVTSPKTATATPTADNNNDVPMTARTIERVRFKSMLVHIPRNEPVVVESAESSLPPSAILFDQLVNNSSGNNSGSTSARLSGRRSSKDMSSRKHAITTAASTKTNGSSGSGSSSSISGLFGQVSSPVDVPSVPLSTVMPTTTANTADTDVPMTARTIERVRFKSMLVHIPRNEPVVEDTTGALPPSAILFEHLVQSSGTSMKSSMESDTTSATPTASSSATNSHKPSVKTTSSANTTSSSSGHVAIASEPTLIITDSVTTAEPEVPMTARTYERVHFKSMLQVIPRNEPIVEECLDHSLPPSAILFQQMMQQSASSSSNSHLKLTPPTDADPSVTTSLPYQSEFPLSGREQQQSHQPSHNHVSMNVASTTGVVSGSTRKSSGDNHHSNDKVHFTSKSTPSTPSSSHTTEKSKTTNTISDNNNGNHSDDVQVEIIPRPMEEIALDTSEAVCQKPPSALLFEQIVEKSSSQSHLSTTE